MNDDKLTITEDHLKKVRNDLASQGIEFSPAELKEQINSIFAKLQTQLASQGIVKTKEQIRDEYRTIVALENEAIEVIKGAFENDDQISIALLFDVIVKNYEKLGMSVRIVERAIERMIKDGLVIQIGDDLMKKKN